MNMHTPGAAGRGERGGGSGRGRAGGLAGPAGSRRTLDETSCPVLGCPGMRPSSQRSTAPSSSAYMMNGYLDRSSGGGASCYTETTQPCCRRCPRLRALWLGATTMIWLGAETTGDGASRGGNPWALRWLQHRRQLLSAGDVDVMTAAATRRCWDQLTRSCGAQLLWQVIREGLAGSICGRSSAAAVAAAAAAASSSACQWGMPGLPAECPGCC